MKKAVLAVLMVVTGIALAGDFGREADKSSVAARKNLLLVRENPATGEKVVFDASNVNAKEIKALSKAEETGAKKDAMVKAIQSVEGSSKATLVASKDAAGSTATTAWWGWYYGSVYVVYYRVVYYTYYTYIPWGGYYYTWYW